MSPDQYISRVCLDEAVMLFMFEVEYCSNPNLGDIQSTGIKYDYAFDVEFDEKLKDLDKFLFLIDMHIIIDSCGSDLLSITIDDFDEFWKINKRLLNFANSVYSYKEYINSYVILEII